MTSGFERVNLLLPAAGQRSGDQKKDEGKRVCREMGIVY